MNCAGMWARQFGEMAGVNVPNQAAEHYYLVTDAMDGVYLGFPNFTRQNGNLADTI